MIRLKNLLAENMIRFGTKNLSEQDINAANAAMDIAQDQKMFHDDIIKALNGNPNWKKAQPSTTTRAAQSLGLNTAYETGDGTQLDTAPQLWLRSKYKLGTQPEQLVFGFKDGALQVYHFNTKGNTNEYDLLYGKNKSTPQDKDVVLNIISGNLTKPVSLAQN